MNTKRLIAVPFALLIGLGACAKDDSSTPVADGYGNSAETTAAKKTTASDGPVIALADSSLGKIMTSDGMTLYGFTMNSDGTPTCNDGCAGAWPPAIVDSSFDLSTLPASGSFTIVDRADGTKQLKAGDWPLYQFAGDSAAGDTNGQGSGGNWFAVAPDASLVK